LPSRRPGFDLAIAKVEWDAIPKEQQVSFIKQLLNQYGTNLFAKVVMRGLLYGATMVQAKLAIQAPSQGTINEIAQWAGAVLTALAALGLDWWSSHQSKKSIVAAQKSAK
jgi:hypothetical protein